MGTLFHIRYECAKLGENVSEATLEPLVTVEFHQNETGIELILTHEQFPTEEVPEKN